RVPELPPAALADRGRERGPATGAGRARGPGAGGRSAGRGRPGAPAPAPPTPAVRPRAAARGAGARLRRPAAAPVCRRAHRQPRPGHRPARQPAAVRAQPQQRHHPGDGHPRPGPGPALPPRVPAGPRPPGAARGRRGRCMNVLRHAARSLRREFSGGDLLTLFAALVLGVAAMTAVGTLVDRVTLALASSAAEVVGGDLGVQTRAEPPAEFAYEERSRGRAVARLVTFPSVLYHGESSQMATVKGVDGAHPLRGRLRVATDAAGLQAADSGGPPPGEAYADPRELPGLGVTVGDAIELGSSQVRITRVLLSEPDASGGLMEMAPPLLVHRDDVEAAGLLGPGSRAGYRMMFAGPPEAIQGMREWLQPRL